MVSCHFPLHAKLKTENNCLQLVCPAPEFVISALGTKSCPHCTVVHTSSTGINDEFSKIIALRGSNFRTWGDVRFSEYHCRIRKFLRRTDGKDLMCSKQGAGQPWSLQFLPFSHNFIPSLTSKKLARQYNNNNSIYFY